MGRLTRQVGINPVRVSLPERASIGPAMIKTAQTVKDIAAQKGIARRTKEANLAAQQMNFERDGEGNLLAPALPVDKNGLVIANVYSEQYTKMVGQRYLQQTELDLTVRLNKIATDFALDPDGYKTVAEAYIDKVRALAPDLIKGTVNGLAQKIMVSHFNHIVNKTSEWEKQNLSDEHGLYVDAQIKELMGLASTHSPDFQIAEQYDKVLSTVLDGAMNTYYNDATAAAAIEEVNKRFAMADLAGYVSDIPNTQMGNAQAMSVYQQFVKGEGDLSIFRDGKMVKIPIEELYPDWADREVAGKRAIKFFSDRETIRALNEKAYHHDQDIRWNRIFMKDLLDPINRGKPFDPTPYYPIREEAVRSNNFELVAQIEAAFGLNYQNEMASNEFDSEAELVQFELNSISKNILPTLTEEQLEFVGDILAEKIPGATLDAVVAGEQVEGARNESFMRYATELKDAIRQAGIHFPAGSNGTRLDREFLRQATNMRDDFIQWRNDFIESEGVENYEDISIEKRTKWEDSLDGRAANFNLQQGPESAEKAIQWYEDIGRYEVDWNTDSPGFLRSHIAQTMQKLGIIDQDAINYFNNTLSNIEKENSTDVVRVLDFYKLMRDEPNLRNKLDNAFGSVNTDGLDFLLKHFNPESMKDSAEVQAVFDRASKGELYDHYKDMTSESISYIYERFNGALKRMNDGGWLGADGAGIPVEMRQQLYDSIPGFAHRVGDDPSNDELDRHAAQAVDSLIESSGWQWSELGLNQDRAGAFFDMFGPDEFLRGFGAFSDALSYQPNNGFSLYPPDKFYRPEDMDAIKVEFQKRLNVYEAGLKAGKNAFLKYNGSLSLIRGERLWEIHIAENDSSPRQLTQDVHYLGEPVYIGFDHIAVLQADEEKLERIEETERNKQSLYENQQLGPWAKPGATR